MPARRRPSAASSPRSASPSGRRGCTGECSRGSPGRRGRLEQVPQEVGRDRLVIERRAHRQAGRVDAGRQVDPVRHLVRPAAVGVARVPRRRRAGVGGLRGTGRSGPGRGRPRPAARQEAVVLHRLAAADEARRELALPVPQQRLVDLDLVRRGDDLVVRLVPLLARPPGRGANDLRRQRPAVRRRRSTPSSFVRPDAQTTCSGPPSAAGRTTASSRNARRNPTPLGNRWPALFRTSTRAVSRSGPSPVGRHVERGDRRRGRRPGHVRDRVARRPPSSRS